MRITPLGVACQADEPRLSSIAAALDARLRVLSAGGVAMIAAHALHTPDPAQIVRWVAALHAAIDIVPIRLDEGLRTDDDAVELLTARAAYFKAALDRIAGCTEFGVRLLVDSTLTAQAVHVEAAPTPSGRDYLSRRARHYASVDGIPGWLEPRAREWLAAMELPGLRARIEGPSPLVHVPQIALLVRRADKEQFTTRYEHTRHLLGVATTLTGPWAPYSFVRSLDPGSG